MTINLAPDVRIPALEFASQGNAVLGIRDSGKTYTAMKAAEELFECKIPFVAFDPIGVWRFLKVGQKRKAGYPVVVAGGDKGDLPLTVESAARIVRAAMQKNISLVIDLYSMNLSKSDWRRIVEECVRLLLYENKKYGLRHIFLEEAAEFVPQQVRPEYGRVYAEIEKLGRMGGNASLGFTLINQRAEQVNKAVLELCDCLILHRQKGRLSLTTLGKWLDVADAGDSGMIVKSLPMLEQGECWIWLQGTNTPVRAKISPKNTVHPDRRNPQELLDTVTRDNTTDVSAFVAELKRSLEQQEREKPDKETPVSEPASPKVSKNEMNLTIQLAEEQSKNAKLDATVRALREEIARITSERKQVERGIEDVKKALLPQYNALRKLFEKIEDIPVSEGGGDLPQVWEDWCEKLGGGKSDIIKALWSKGPLNRQQLVVLTKLGRESVRIYVNKLKSANLIREDEKNTLRLMEIA